MFYGDSKTRPFPYLAHRYPLAHVRFHGRYRV
jgi:hypothetical protein